MLADIVALVGVCFLVGVPLWWMSVSMFAPNLALRHEEQMEHGSFVVRWLNFGVAASVVIVGSCLGGLGAHAVLSDFAASRPFGLFLDFDDGVGGGVVMILAVAFGLWFYFFGYLVAKLLVEKEQQRRR